MTSELDPPADRGIGGVWAVVLAGGAGSRLRSLTTTPNGVIVPKQYCSLRRGPSLLTQALIRCSSVAPTIRTCAVVAAQHCWWWEPLLESLPKENVFVQPEDRGTAHGILLALLQLEARDPESTVLMLPADHYVRHESLLAQSLRHAADLAARTGDAIYILGTAPDRNDTELGYIVPADLKSDCPARVTSFVEKPGDAAIERLLKLGALWNMFIFAGSVHALLALYDRAYEDSVAMMRAAIRAGGPLAVDSEALSDTYKKLPPVDFSRHLLEPQAAKLQVLCVPPCGWNDLGTPKRVIETLLELQSEFKGSDPRIRTSAALSLADQYGRISRGRSLSTLQ